MTSTYTQSCLERIFQLIRDEQQFTDDYDDAFRDLADLLISGADPPVLRSINDALPTEGHTHTCVIWLPSTFHESHYEIQPTDLLNRTGNGPYAFIVWSYNYGRRKFKIALPMVSKSEGGAQ